ncbi:MAG TPA: glycogen debranching enzyme, partial [Spirochaetia bacterium]|nr:glycogen debranching enzyme [Spirochaetia bacterium]
MKKAAYGTLRTSPGSPLPFGARPNGKGTQFSAFSRNATAVSLLLFDSPQASTPVREIELDPRLNRTGDVWHVQVDGAGPGAFYLYRVDGPWQPEAGHRFDPRRLLLDPYVKAVAGSFEWNPRADGAGAMPKGIIVADDFDWRGDRPLARPLRFTTIYETHVRGLTLSPTSGVAHPGTFRGVVEKIPYFVDL